MKIATLRWRGPRIVAKTADSHLQPTTCANVEIVHLGNDKSRLSEAEHGGVKSVPALVVDGHAFHINHGADLSALKG